MLKKLSIQQILELIKNEKPFSAISTDNAFTIAVNDYLPFICTAIHHGHNLRPSLRSKVALTREERWQEEDPITGQFIGSLPVHIIVNDSRFEYDLNKSPKNCIYKEAWGKNVWNTPLSVEEKRQSQKKHVAFYKVIDALVSKIIQKHKSCIIYDIHSYNYKLRQYDKAPLFNLGTKFIDKRKYGEFTKHWIDELQNIKLRHIKNTTTENVIFCGKGYLAEHISKKHQNTLVLPTEIRKIYLDEKSGDEYPEIINTLSDKLKNAIINNAAFFTKKATTLKIRRKHKLLSSILDTEALEVDQAIYNLYHKIDVLEFVNPYNIEAEKKKFFQAKHRYKPKFVYHPLNINTKEIKKELYQIKTESIKDIDIQNFYRDVIEDYVNQLDMLSARSTKNFLYSSLKYYGEPTEKDISNADYLMHCPVIKELCTDLDLVDAKQTAKYFSKECQRYKLNYKIEFVRDLPSLAAFSPSKKQLQIKRDAQFTNRFAKGLAHHEVGVHAVTTHNASIQPLKILQTGFPGYTTTQEGIALLSEFLSGYLDIFRLQEIALRVIAVNHMIHYYNFNETFRYLINNYDINHEMAFYITVRVYRGGGFTKDYVYLKGFRQVLNTYKGMHSHYLLAGKTSLKYLPLLEELIHRDILKTPKIITHSFTNPKKPNPILDYVINGLG